MTFSLLSFRRVVAYQRGLTGLEYLSRRSDLTQFLRQIQGRYQAIRISSFSTNRHMKSTRRFERDDSPNSQKRPKPSLNIPSSPTYNDLDWKSLQGSPSYQSLVNGNPEGKVIILAGATAAGKSALSLEIARLLTNRTEIVIADSVQVYKGLDIGANKPTIEEISVAPHHLIDIATPSEAVTTADFSMKAAKKILEILARGKIPIVVGGATMWIQWLVHGMPDAPKPSAEAVVLASTLIDHLEKERDWDNGLDILKQYSEKEAKTISRNDWYRLRRYLEIGLDLHFKSKLEHIKADDVTDKIGDTAFEIRKRARESSPERRAALAQILQEKGNDVDCKPSLTGRRISIFELAAAELARESGLDASNIPLDLRCFFLTELREELYRTIDLRCEKMLRMGLGKEVRDLVVSKTLLPNYPISKAIGYRQVLEYLGNKDLPPKNFAAFAQFFSDFTSATRNYAKKQMNWYRKDEAFLFLRVQRQWPQPTSILVHELLACLVSSRSEYESTLHDQLACSEHYANHLKRGKVPVGYQAISEQEYRVIRELLSSKQINLLPKCGEFSRPDRERKWAITADNLSEQTDLTKDDSRRVDLGADSRPDVATCRAIDIRFGETLRKSNNLCAFRSTSPYTTMLAAEISGKRALAKRKQAQTKSPLTPEQIAEDAKFEELEACIVEFDQFRADVWRECASEMEAFMTVFSSPAGQLHE